MTNIAHDPIVENLPFVTEGKNYRVAWDVSETGDYITDYEKGKSFARKLISAIRREVISPMFTALVIEAMPAEKGVIERAFLNELTVAAAYQ